MGTSRELREKGGDVLPHRSEFQWLVLAIVFKHAPSVRARPNIALQFAQMHR
jgi:hypothetical protein